jgi:multicomponent Na+:H+ antiporter subunit F
MMAFALAAGFTLLTLAVLSGLYRLARGPSVLDRVMAFDLITTAAVGMIILLSVKWNTPLYLELILVVSLLGFLTTVAFVFYLNQTNRRPPGSSPRSSAP